MATGSYIVRGLGNPESFQSCSHGAGRLMSRGQAERTITLQPLLSSVHSLDEIECAFAAAARPDTYRVFIAPE